MTIVQKLGLFVTVVCEAVSLYAQTVQPGITLEYNEKNVKTALGGVEIIIRDAGSTVSDANGNFTLTFNTLQPGDKVVYRSIQKSGYELFNKQALEQWYISKDKKPFQIVLCRSDKFKSLTENYQRVSSESYARQYKRDQESLAKQLKEGFLKEEEYKKQLLSLEDKYYEDLKNLDNYVDMFARIDLSELSNQEQKIIELLQNGDIDEAIRAYESQNYLEKFKQEVSDKNEIASARKKLEELERQKAMSMESLLASIERQISAYKLAGGYDNYKKIGDILRNLALADTTNYEMVNRYAKFSHKQNNYEEAYYFYRLCLNCSVEKEKLATTYINLGSLYREMNKYVESEKYLKKAVNYYSEKINFLQSNAMYNVAKAENELGNLFYVQKKYSKAEKHFYNAYDIWQTIYHTGNEAYLSDLAGVLNNLGLVYMSLQNIQEAKKYIIKAIETYQRLRESDPDMYERYLAMAQSNLGVLFFQTRQWEETELYWTSATNHYQNLYEKNPHAYSFDLAKSRYNLGRYYKAFNRIEEAKNEYQKALEIFNYCYLHNASIYGIYVAETKNALAYVYISKEDFNTALKFVDEAIELIPSEINFYDTKGEILVLKGNMQAAFDISQKIKALDPDYFNKNKSEWYKNL